MVCSAWKFRFVSGSVHRRAISAMPCYPDAKQGECVFSLSTLRKQQPDHLSTILMILHSVLFFIYVFEMEQRMARTTPSFSKKQYLSAVTLMLLSFRLKNLEKNRLRTRTLMFFLLRAKREHCYPIAAEQ